MKEGMAVDRDSKLSQNMKQPDAFGYTGKHSYALGEWRYSVFFFFIEMQSAPVRTADGSGSPNGLL